MPLMAGGPLQAPVCLSMQGEGPLLPHRVIVSILRSCFGTVPVNIRSVHRVCLLFGLEQSWQSNQSPHPLSGSLLQLQTGQGASKLTESQG